MEKGTLIFVIFSVAVLLIFLLTSWKSHAKFTAKILFEQNIAFLPFLRPKLKKISTAYPLLFEVVTSFNKVELSHIDIEETLSSVRKLDANQSEKLKREIVKVIENQDEHEDAYKIVEWYIVTSMALQAYRHPHRHRLLMMELNLKASKNTKNTKQTIEDNVQHYHHGLCIA